MNYRLACWFYPSLIILFTHFSKGFLQLLDSIYQLYSKLQQASYFTVVIDSPHDSCRAVGEGTVLCKRIDQDYLYVHETARVEFANKSSTEMTGAWFWQFEKKQVTLGHLRYGEDKPVPLSKLVLVDSGYESQGIQFSGAEPYLCGEDSYRVEVRVLAKKVGVVWFICGPKKQQIVTRTYYMSNNI